jgi:hypothetical protein
MSPSHPEFAHFQPCAGIPMGYSDLKVTEAFLFLESIVDGAQRTPGVREMAAAARVLDAMARSSASGAWEEVGDGRALSEATAGVETGDASPGSGSNAQHLSL